MENLKENQPYTPAWSVRQPRSGKRPPPLPQWFVNKQAEEPTRHLEWLLTGFAMALIVVSLFKLLS